MNGSPSILQDPPSCIFIEYKKEVFLTAVGLAAIGALVIGILAVLSNVDILNGVGAISQLGLAGGGALSGLGFFVLMLIGAYCVYRWWSQPKESKPELYGEGDPLHPYPRNDLYPTGTVQGTPSPLAYSPYSPISPVPIYYPSTSDYRHADLRDLFPNREQFDRLFPYEFKNYEVPSKSMTHSVMKGNLPDEGECLVIRLKCISTKSEILSKIDVKQSLHSCIDKGMGRATLMLFKSQHQREGEIKWLQNGRHSIAKPSFFRDFNSNCFEGEAKLFESPEEKEQNMAREKEGFARVQELLRTGETTDTRGLRWSIA